jgi:hypothetical protein
MAGIATTLTSWNPVIRLAKPPRATLTRLNRGATLGEPHHVAQQLRVLQATLALLQDAAPQEVVTLAENP